MRDLYRNILNEIFCCDLLLIIGKLSIVNDQNYRFLYCCSMFVLILLIGEKMTVFFGGIENFLIFKDKNICLYSFIPPSIIYQITIKINYFI